MNKARVFEIIRYRVRKERSGKYRYKAHRQGCYDNDRDYYRGIALYPFQHKNISFVFFYYIKSRVVYQYKEKRLSFTLSPLLLWIHGEFFYQFNKPAIKKIDPLITRNKNNTYQKHYR